MEIPGLYKIVSRQQGEDNTFIYEAEINPAHAIFKGHFPDMPVMPGVCMLQLLKECIADAVCKPLRIHYIRSCKFVSVVNPIEHSLLTISFTLSDMNLQATLSTNAAPALKLKAILMEA